MSGQTRLASLISAIGADVKAILPRLLPAGGTTGQVLTKSSNADYATQWLSGLPVAPMPASGQVVMAPGILGTGSSALISGRAAFYPNPVAAGTYDALVFTVNTAQSGGTVLAKAALYLDDGTGGMPNTVAAPVAVVTLPALTSTGNKVATLGTPWVAKAGLYWACFFYYASSAPTTTPAVTCVTNATYAIPQITAAFPARIKGWQRTGLTDLPTDATTTANATGSGNNDVPVIALRAA